MDTLSECEEPLSSNELRFTSLFRNAYQDEDSDKENSSPNNKRLEKMISRVSLIQKKLVSRRKKYFYDSISKEGYSSCGEVMDSASPEKGYRKI